MFSCNSTSAYLRYLVLLYIMMFRHDAIPATTTTPFEVESVTTSNKDTMSLVTAEIRAKAEIYYGQERFEERSKFMLQEAGLPLALLPLKDVEECGYVEETGFVWVKQKKKITHNFDKVKRLATYDAHITAFVEPFKIRKLQGVKVKEFLIWLTLNEIFVDNPCSGKLTFKTPQGLFRSFPVSAFHLEGVKPVKAAEEVKDIKKEAHEVKKDDECMVELTEKEKAKEGLVGGAKEKEIGKEETVGEVKAVEKAKEGLVGGAKEKEIGKEETVGEVKAVEKGKEEMVGEVKKKTEKTEALVEVEAV